MLYVNNYNQLNFYQMRQNPQSRAILMVVNQSAVDTSHLSILHE